MNERNIRVTTRGAARWSSGHPWIYRSDTLDHPPAAGLFPVLDRRGKFLGQALYSPASEISLRLLEPSERPVDTAWWVKRIRGAWRRRASIEGNGYRVVHGEGDALPSLVVDRYDRSVVMQLLSAGLETMRAEIVAAVREVLVPEGILLRHDAPVRRHEGLSEQVELAWGSVPERVEIWEGRVRYFAAPWTGQKTGAFLDQRPNRLLAGELVPREGRALDCFAYHGSFALHLAGRAREVIALDSSEEALERGRKNADLNGRGNITWRQGDAFDVLRDFDRARERFDVVVVDPPAFAKSRDTVASALRGYHEINRRAMRLLAPRGALVTASCSFHVRRPDFEAMLGRAASDSGRRLVVEQWLGQGVDHPEVLTIPETGYLKGAVLRAE